MMGALAIVGVILGVAVAYVCGMFVTFAIVTADGRMDADDAIGLCIFWPVMLPVILLVLAVWTLPRWVYRRMREAANARAGDA